MEKLNVLDCTLRDGGYYTNWEFDDEFIDKYTSSIKSLPVDYIEIGYRSKKLDQPRGEYFYLSLEKIKKIKQQVGSKSICIMLNLKDCLDIDVQNLLSDCVSYVDLVRIAVPPADISKGKELSLKIKNIGFKTAINIMYIHRLVKDREIYEELIGIEKYLDVLYLVDSYGALYPKELSFIIREIRKRTQINLGFHGHNNIELAFANTLTAIDHDVSFIDATIAGIGRGAGNLKTELLLQYLNKFSQLDLDVEPLINISEYIENLNSQYKWGSNIAYAQSGFSRKPQAGIMSSLKKHSIREVFEKNFT